MNEVEKLMKEILQESIPNSSDTVKVISKKSGREYEITKDYYKSHKYKYDVPTNKQKDKAVTPKINKKTAVSKDKSRSKQNLIKKLGTKQKIIEPKVDKFEKDYQTVKAKLNSVPTQKFQHPKHVAEYIEKGKDMPSAPPGKPGGALVQIYSCSLAKLKVLHPQLELQQLAVLAYGDLEGKGLSKGIPPTKGKKILSGIPDKALYSKCLVSAESAMVKARTVSKAIQTCKDKGLIDQGEIVTSWGSKLDIQQQVNIIKNATKIYAPNGQEITKQDALAWTLMQGGGVNPTDSSIFYVGKNGGLIITNYSDKSDVKDQQYNTTPKKRYDDAIMLLSRMDIPKKQKDMVIKSLKLTQKNIYQQQNKLKTGIAQEVAEAAITKLSSEQIEELTTEGEFIHSINKALYGVKYKKIPEQNRKIASAFKKYAPKGKQEGQLTDHDKLLMVLESARHGKYSNTAGRVITKISERFKHDHPQFDIDEKISNVRKNTIEYIRNSRLELNKTKVIHNGEQYGAGDYAELHRVYESLHLGRMDGKYQQGNPESVGNLVLGIVMGQADVDGETLMHCLGVKNFDEFLNKYSIKQSDTPMHALNNPSKITGQAIYLYEKQNGTELGKSVYRSKGGDSGNLGESFIYSVPMQKCFKSYQKVKDKRVSKQALRASKNHKKFQKGINELLYQLLKGKG